MKLLFDECVPRTLKRPFVAAGHDCQTVREVGWEALTNGELLAQAEGSFDVLITVDKNLRYQQNLKNRLISILIFRAVSNDLDHLKQHVPSALIALESIKPGQIIEI